MNIYPAEIEAALSAHPAVADVAVFGIPPDWGEEVKAWVEPFLGIDPARRRPPAAGLLTPDRGVQAAATIDYVEASPATRTVLYKRKLRDPYWVTEDRI